MRLERVQTLCFVGAIFLYAALGSPTPDHPGYLEMVIAALLICATGSSGLWGAARYNVKAPAWFVAGQVFLIYGLCAATLGGVLAGHGLTAMARDMAAFLLMLLPLFCLRAVPEKALLFSALGLGLLFAVRAQFDMPGLALGEALFYLANAPTVLFAAIAFAGLALQSFVERFSLAALMKAGLLIFMCVLCLLPMIETQQRASLGAFVLSMMFLLGVYLWRSPRRSSFVLVAVLGAGLVYGGQVLGVFEDLSRKTALVGVNMRVEEWAAVWGEIASNPFRAMFGRGWGATFSNPAVAGITVNYTHGLASSLLLKTGVFGLVLGLGYVWLLALGLYPALRQRPVLAVALAAPLLIDVFLYASFKSLDFGVILLLIATLSQRRVFYGEDRADEIASAQGLLYSKHVAK